MKRNNEELGLSSDPPKKKESHAMTGNVIGRQIQTLRNRYQMTQEDLAIKLGVSKQTISNWETGLKIPRMGAIQNLASFFNVSKSFIIEGKEESPDELLTIYDQLSNNRKKEVVDFAKFKLSEQQKSEQEEQKIYTLAAHFEDRDRKVTAEDIDKINAILDEIDRKHEK